MTNKYKLKVVLKSAKHFDKKLFKEEVELKKNILVDKVNSTSNTLTFSVYTNDIFLVNAYGYTASVNNWEFYFMVTDYKEVFYTNDVDGTYFSTLFYVDANLPKGVKDFDCLKTEFDSELDIIDNIEQFMDSEYSDLNKALEAINEYIKTIDKDCFYIVKNYIVFENEEDWINAFANFDEGK